MSREAVDRRVAAVGIVRAGGELKVAAILFTYRCTIACRHCLFGCRAARPDVAMDPERCVRYLGQLHELGRVVHIAGGEAMMYWPSLADALRRAKAAGVAPHFLESNGSFATAEATTRERLQFLKDMGLAGILLSSDPYHQEFVDPASYLRARRVAVELFGQANVWANHAPEDDIRAFAAVAADPARLRAFVRRNPPRLTGTACAELAPFLDPVPPEHLPPEPGWTAGCAAHDCAAEFDAARVWEVHIDPYDNIQTNCGVILGNAVRTSVADVLAAGPAETSPIAAVLAAEGPLGLARLARERHGFVIPATVRQKCELCYLTRRFLRPFYPDVLGPDEVYA